MINPYIIFQYVAFGEIKLKNINPLQCVKYCKNTVFGSILEHVLASVTIFCYKTIN